MGKILRKAQKRLEARKLACIATRVMCVGKKFNAELAYKMPGSMKK